MRMEVTHGKVNQCHSQYFGGDYANFNGHLSNVERKWLVRVLKDQRGFLATPIIVYGLVIFMTVVPILLGIVVGARHKAVQTYQYFSEAMEFAISAVNVNGNINVDELAQDQSVAQQYFELAFAKMIDGTVSGDTISPKSNGFYPGSVTVSPFITVKPGDAVPEGTAKQPGYMTTISVPLLSANLPWVGTRYIEVPMRYYAVAKSTQNNN